ncbi:iron chaperone [Leifsonia sp. NPDC058292]|uniref:iron chaperone n=1 Tax=Leifsonia sp. NPDC058292 TaxID=3346428 RepID=UPI0036DAF1C2
MARGVEASTVDEYLEGIGQPFAGALRIVRDRILEVLPESEQVISYRVPVFKYRGRGLIGLSATAKECSLLLMSPPAAAALAGKLTEGKISGATLHFSAEFPLTVETLRTIIRYRIAEVDELSQPGPS